MLNRCLWGNNKGFASQVSKCMIPSSNIWHHVYIVLDQGFEAKSFTFICPHDLTDGSPNLYLNAQFP